MKSKTIFLKSIDHVHNIFEGEHIDTRVRFIENGNSGVEGEDRGEFNSFFLAADEECIDQPRIIQLWLKTYNTEQAGVNKGILAQKQIAHPVVSGQKILSMRDVEGLAVEAGEIPDGINAEITVLEGTTIELPVHLCFGILRRTGTQNIGMNIRFEKDARARFLAFTLSFPK